jgi:hypothetical protein
VGPLVLGPEVGPEVDPEVGPEVGFPKRTITRVHTFRRSLLGRCITWGVAYTGLSLGGPEVGPLVGPETGPEVGRWLDQR